MKTKNNTKVLLKKNLLYLQLLLLPNNYAELICVFYI